MLTSHLAGVGGGGGDFYEFRVIVVKEVWRLYFSIKVYKTYIFYVEKCLNVLFPT